MVSDGFYRSPCTTEGGGYEPNYSRMIRSEVMTMSLVRRKTSIPIPEVYDYSEISQNEIGVPYMLMEFAQGVPVTDIWFGCDGDDDGAKPPSPGSIS